MENIDSTLEILAIFNELRQISHQKIMINHIYIYELVWYCVFSNVLPWVAE